MESLFEFLNVFLRNKTLMGLYIRHSAGSVRKGRGPNDRETIFLIT